MTKLELIHEHLENIQMPENIRVKLLLLNTTRNIFSIPIYSVVHTKYCEKHTLYSHLFQDHSKLNVLLHTSDKQSLKESHHPKEQKASGEI